MSPQRPTAPVMSRAMRNARTTSACDTPVSVTIRDTNVMPWEFTTSLEAIVAMISRFKRVLGEQMAEPLDDLGREVPLEVGRQVVAVGQIRGRRAP